MSEWAKLGTMPKINLGAPESGAIEQSEIEG